jgi:hypothetical protein
MSISHLIDYLNKHEPDIHKFYSTQCGFANLSDKNGLVYMIRNTTTLSELKDTIRAIKTAPYKYKGHL